MSLSSEVLLRILGFLDDPKDLVRCRRSNRRLYNIAGDTLLWRDLFVHTFLRSPKVEVLAESPRKKRRRLSNEDHHEEAIPARVIKQIPRMQHNVSISAERRNDEEDLKVDWYALYKISHNWQTGSFSTRYLQKHLNAAQDKSSSIAQASQSLKLAPASRVPQTLVDSSADYIFAAFNSTFDTDSPSAILVFRSDGKVTTKEEGKQESIASYQIISSKKTTRASITSLAVDRGCSQDDLTTLFVGCSDGSSSLIAFDHRSYTFGPLKSIRSTSSDAIVAAVLTLPLLVTCTAGFHLRLYKVEKGDTSNITLLEERRTYSCHWPASLRLEAISEDSSPSKEAHRFSIAYSTPVYPLGWTVGLQEILIKEDFSTSSRSASARKACVVTEMESFAKQGQHSKTQFIGSPSLAERRQEVGRLTSLSYEDPYVVVGTKDNDVVCFKVDSAANRNSPLDDLGLSHICNSQGHTGTVHSVSLSEGRCVTGGSDGSVRVWKLGDEEASLAKATGLLATFDARLRRGLGKVISLSSSLHVAGKRKREEEIDHASPLSLADILRDSRKNAAVSGRNSSSSAVVRLVSSAFDRIISVSSVRNHFPISDNRGLQSIHCRSEAMQEEEQIQIWSFA